MAPSSQEWAENPTHSLNAQMQENPYESPHTPQESHEHQPTSVRTKYAVWICVFLLLALHQDYWQWDDATLDFGFMPRTLTYHAILSVIAAVLWFLATLFCWPKNLACKNLMADTQDESSDEVTS